MAQAATAQRTADPALRALLARITRDQGPEVEQTLNFSALQTVSTPVSLKTDRKIKFYQLHMRGRLTNGGTGPTLRTAPPLLGTQLFALIQQITIRGTHLRYGAQTPFVMRGETLAEMMALFIPGGYFPQFTVTNSAGGTNGRSGVLSTTNAATVDFDFTLPIPLVPLGITPADMVFYGLHGPDWPGNLYMDIQCADGTALASANAATLTAFGSGSGSATIEIVSERPLVSKEFMSRIRPALCYHVTNFTQPTAAAGSGGVTGSGIKLADLLVGKDTTRLFIKSGVAGTGTSTGVTTYGSLSDGIFTRTFFSLDSRQLRFGGANGDSTLQDYQARAIQRPPIPVGYKVIDFISNPGDGPANVKAAFPSSKLTAARKFELDADVTTGANQIAEVVQEMILGRPAIV